MFLLLFSRFSSWFSFWSFTFSTSKSLTFSLTSNFRAGTWLFLSYHLRLPLLPLLNCIPSGLLRPNLGSMQSTKVPSGPVLSLFGICLYLYVYYVHMHNLSLSVLLQYLIINPLELSLYFLVILYSLFPVFSNSYLHQNLFLDYVSLSLLV